jgi:hypothetical protein
MYYHDKENIKHIDVNTSVWEDNQLKISLNSSTKSSEASVSGSKLKEL